jgi:hypothetical protein
MKRRITSAGAIAQCPAIRGFAIGPPWSGTEEPSEPAVVPATHQHPMGMDTLPPFISAGRHYVDIVGVAGSIPAAPTMKTLRKSSFFVL